MQNPIPDKVGRTFICSIVFLDIVEYSTQTVAKQLALKGWMNDILTQALKSVSEVDRIILDTGDGVAMCFLGDPEEALFVSNNIRVALNEQQYPGLVLRTGINLGPVKLVTDINGRPNIIGDGINVAQRVMSFADPTQILVSRSYYEVVARLSDEYTKLFVYHGEHQDKHVRKHEVYEVRINAPPDIQAFGSDPGGRPAAPLEPAAPRKPAAAPIKPAAPPSKPAAPAKPQAAPPQAAPPQAAPPQAAALPPEAAKPQPPTAEPEAAKPQPPTAQPEAAEPQPRAAPPPPASTPASTVAPAAFPEEVLASFGRQLAKYLGPIAPFVVAKGAKKAASVEELTLALADMIPVPAQRDRFLQEMAGNGGSAQPPADGKQTRTVSAPAPQAASSKSSVEGGGADAVLPALERLLASYMGPMAKILVAKTAKHARSDDELINRLAEGLDKERDRAAFLTAAATVMRRSGTGRGT